MASDPEDAAAAVRIDGPSPVRVLLFGTVALAHDAELDRCVAEEIATATARGVVLDTLLAKEWTAPDPILALDAQAIERYDAIVVISTYRPSLADVPVDRWLGSVVEVRDLLVRRARPEAVVQVLSLPWRQAAVHAPAVWGGAAGQHIRTLDRLAGASLGDVPSVLRLTLSEPTSPGEWTGPSFAGATCRTWAVEIAAQLAAALDAGAARSA